MTSSNGEKNNQIHDGYLFVDLETGGLYPDKHSILQVAAIITDLDFKIQSTFMSYVKPHPDLKVAEDALAINQLNWDDLQAAPEEKAVAQALHHFANLRPNLARFAGYNCQFDLEFLSHFWKRHELVPIPYQVPWLDIYAVAKAKLEAHPEKLPNFKLVSVANYFGLKTDGAHDAVEDLMMTIELAKLLKGLPDKNEAKDLETIKFSVRQTVDTLSDQVTTAVQLTISYGENKSELENKIAKDEAQRQTIKKV